MYRAGKAGPPRPQGSPPMAQLAAKPQPPGPIDFDVLVERATRPLPRRLPDPPPLPRAPPAARIDPPRAIVLVTTVATCQSCGAPIVCRTTPSSSDTMTLASPTRSITNAPTSNTTCSALCRANAKTTPYPFRSVKDASMSNWCSPRLWGCPCRLLPLCRPVPDTAPTAEIIMRSPPIPADPAPDPANPRILIFDHFRCRGPDFKWIDSSIDPKVPECAEMRAAFWSGLLWLLLAALILGAYFFYIHGGSHI
jgi:hypothetical protein